MSSNLFQEFDKTSSKIWKQKIQADLKGADYNDTLIWRTNESIDVKPFYHPDGFNPKSFPQALYPKETWKIGEPIEISNAKEANDLAKHAISRGAETLLFHLNEEEVNVRLLLKDLSSIPVFLISQQVWNWISPNVRVLYDPIRHFANTGNWFHSQASDLSNAIEHVKQKKTVFVDGTFYQNSGATIVQQLAYMIAHLNEYLNALEESVSFDFSTLEVHFRTAVGSNYFFEIAKLRALRLLWQSLSSAYSIQKSCHISATPGFRNKSIYDYNVNMLRTTTECMSAILGGADTVYNLPYDALYHKSNEFGNRISRNQLLILKHESYFDKVKNAAEGAYYIETLTNELANKALDIFKSIESAGGMIKQLMEGTIQRKIKESAALEQEQFDSGNLVLLGVNTFPNERDKMKGNLEINPFMEIKKRKTLIEP
jgi:methylmalonyl-CoA mutase